MKKVLSVVLSIMIVVIGLMPAASALYKPGVSSRVVKGAYTGDPTEDISVVKDDVFTLVFKMPAVNKLVGAGFYVSFDDTVLKVLNVNHEGLCYKVDSESNKTVYFNGDFVSGMKNASTDEFSFGFMSLDGVSKNAAKDFAYVTFRVLNTKKSNTTVNLYTTEFQTEDGDDTNDVKSETLLESKIINFDFSEYVPTTSKTTTEKTTKATDVKDINGLIALIKDILTGNGATWADVSDAVANILGNSELSDMIEQLMGGNIGEGFLDKLKDIGLDFGALEDILNKIIDFIKGLFNGDETTPATSTTSGYNDYTEEDVTGDPATTQNGSQNGSEDTGDIGIALAVTVCVAGAAAFALTRKKKED